MKFPTYFLFFFNFQCPCDFCRHPTFTHPPSFLIFLIFCSLWRNILADKPRVTKFPISWDDAVKDEADMGDQQQQQQDDQQQQEAAASGMESGYDAPMSAGMGIGGTPPVLTTAGDMDMNMD